MIDFSTYRYEAEHGKKPRGTGHWAFEISDAVQYASGKTDRVVFWAVGSYGMAKRDAIRQCKQHGFTGTVIVLP